MINKTPNSFEHPDSGLQAYQIFSSLGQGRTENGKIVQKVLL